MSETEKLIDVLKKVENCLYIFVDQFDAYLQPKQPLKSTRGLRKLSDREINSISNIFDRSTPVYRGVGIYEAHIKDIKSEEVIPILEEFVDYIEENGEDEYFSLSEFLGNVKGEYELNPDTFTTISVAKKLYSTNINNEIKELKQGVSIMDVLGDEMIIDHDTFEITMETMAGIIIGKKLFWLP